MHERAPEVAAREPGEEAAYCSSSGDRARGPPQRRAVGGRGALAEHDVDRVAGDDVEEQKYERRGAEHRRDQREEAARQVLEHFYDVSPRPGLAGRIDADMGPVERVRRFVSKDVWEAPVESMPRPRRVLYQAVRVAYMTIEGFADDLVHDGAPQR